MDEESN